MYYIHFNSEELSKLCDNYHSILETIRICHYKQESVQQEIENQVQ